MHACNLQARLAPRGPSELLRLRDVLQHGLHTRQVRVTVVQRVQDLVAIWVSSVSRVSTTSRVHP